MPLIRSEKNYEFDVAFSLLSKDEDLGMQLNNLLKDRYRTFIYTEHQDKIIGKEGTTTFREIFQEKSRIAVILYREEWGTTPMTRVEEAAIQHRSLDESYDFTLFVSLDKKKPLWLSKTYIWYDFEKLGIKFLVGLIERKIAEYGGQIIEEKFENIITRLEREKNHLHLLDLYLKSPQGINDNLAELNSLLNIVKQESKLLEKIFTNNVYLFSSEKEFRVSIRSYSLSIKFIQKYLDSCLGSILLVRITNLDYFDDWPGANKVIYEKEEYIFYKNEINENRWATKNDKAQLYTSEMLVDYWLKRFLNKVQVR